MLDYKSIFDKFIERLFALDTTETKLDISYYSHYPKPKQIQYEKAYSYLLNEFKRIETKELYDLEYSFNMIQDELSNFILLIHEYNRALEQGGAEFDFYIDFWNDENIKILEDSISLFKKKINTTQPLKKSNENNLPNTKRIMNFHLILFNALTENQKQKTSFQSYFKREAKVAERDNFVEFPDYFSGCQHVLESYKNEIIRQYNKRLTENDWVVSSVKSGNGIKFGDEIVTDQSDKRIQDSLHRISEDVEYVKSLGYVNNIDYVCYLTDMGEITTNIWERNFEQKLYWQDIVQIEQGVYQAKEELVLYNSIPTTTKPLQVNPRSVPSDNLSIISQAMPNKNDYDIDIHAANLGHCISTATRWDMKAIKKTITDNTPYSVFTPYFDKYHELFNNFKKALRIEFDNPQNGKGFEIDMINRFSNMIKLYYNWYEEHKEETKIFDPYNPYEYIYSFVQEAELELKKYFKFEIPKNNNVDIFSIINEYEDFSESTKARVNAIFESNIDKTQKLDTYFKEIFPGYISETNNLLSILQEMENSFKSTLPALTDDHNKLVSINAKFKTQIFESIEKVFYRISEIDSNRFYSEYFEAINFLETRLELNNKQIASFFKTLEKRLKQLKENNINSTIAHTDKKIIPKIKPTIDRTLNESEFETYFKPTFKGMGDYKINNFANLVEDLKLNRTPRVFAQIALLIYESKQLNSRKPTYFSEWYNIFCECVGCEHKKYDPKDLRPISKNVMSLFSYLLV